MLTRAIDFLISNKIYKHNVFFLLHFSVFYIDF